MNDQRALKDLFSIGGAMLEDFRILGITSVSQLKRRSAHRLYDRLCRLTGTLQDICVLDAFQCAIAQANDQNLPAEQCRWYYWSRVRKASTPKERSRKR